MRILIARTDRIGDVLLSTPVIKAVRGKFPGAYVAFLVRPETADIVRNNPGVDEVIICDKLKTHKGLTGIFRLSSRLSGLKFDMALILHPTNRVHLACFFAGIPRRVGFDRKLGFLLTDRLAHTKQEGVRHETEYTLDVARRVGADTGDKRPVMCVPEGVREAAASLLRAHGIEAGMRAVAVHAGASCVSKRWPAENFARVAETLARDYGVSIVLVGGKDDAAYSREVARGVRDKINPADLTGKTSVSLLGGVLEKCALLISNDSGPVHVAVAVGTPVISIFGRKDPGLSPDRWAPLGPRDVALHKDAGCDVCLAHNCDKGFLCLKAVTPGEAALAAGRILEPRFDPSRQIPGL
ncbi:MAG: glycosyltransferase family 9 protein [Candidatus Omnitrophota bacterium]